MNTRWRLLILAVVSLALALTAQWWLPWLLSFAQLNSELIQGLEALLAIVLGLGGLVFGFLFWKRGKDPEPDPQPEREIYTGGGAYHENITNPSGGDGVAGDQNKAEIGEMHGGVVSVGNGNVINTRLWSPYPASQLPTRMRCARLTSPTSSRPPASCSFLALTRKRPVRAAPA
jgi:hypothetical protein